MTCLSLEPLPKNLFKFGLDETSSLPDRPQAASVAVDVPVSEPLTVPTPSVLISHPSPVSTGLTDIPVSEPPAVTTSSAVLISLPPPVSTGQIGNRQQISLLSPVMQVDNSSNISKPNSGVLNTVPKVVHPEGHTTTDACSVTHVEVQGSSTGESEVDDVLIVNESSVADSGASRTEKNKDASRTVKNKDALRIVKNKDALRTVKSKDTSRTEKNKDASRTEKSKDASGTERSKDVLPIEGSVDDVVPNTAPEKSVEPQGSSISNKTDNVETDFKKQTRGKRRCPECGISITAKLSLRKHLQNFSLPLTDSWKCSICELILQSQCALTMHLRIHSKAKPFRCPECAIEFTLFDRFIMHLKYTCCHMTKVVRYVCSVCSSMQNSPTDLEQHLLLRHVRSIYKCGSCPVAFISMKSAEKHKEREHPGRIVPTHSYQQCKLCPEKLIPKKRFLSHMKNHLNDDKVRVYAFQCPTCKSTFFHRTELVYHRMKCDSRDRIIRSVLEDDIRNPEKNVESFYSNVDAKVANNEAEVEFVTAGSNKQKLSQLEDEIQLIQEEEKDPLSLEDFQMEEPLQEPMVETCVVCKTEKVLILPGKDQSSQSLCCKKCVRPFGVFETPDSVQKIKLTVAKPKRFKCRICVSSNYMDQKNVIIHFKHYHKDIEGESINDWLITENSVPNNKKSNTITTAETIIEKYKKKRASCVVTQSAANQSVGTKIELVESQADDKSGCSPPEKKRPKRLIKLKKVAMSEGNQFESGQILVIPDADKSEFPCSSCSFVGTNKLELHDHVICHRSDPNALQCLECGECFVVLPSFEKHLIINHRITDVDKYINDNKQCLPTILKDIGLTMWEANDSETSTMCKVCSEVFESRSALDKHFRSHGMAFLFKKP